MSFEEGISKVLWDFDRKWNLSLAKEIKEGSEREAFKLDMER